MLAIRRLKIIIRPLKMINKLKGADNSRIKLLKIKSITVVDE